ncbi:hypothetical protein CEXT_450761 [Caerostris extrusa]|uniref:Uncharacterized protein n=1 Tax=Caerostris extrusa TaxID=172846 RepID=A0AAV4WF46_CAEEX|nr:hypothetical protein CEXT_450761 [Caerostris extrusa]
MNVSYSASKLFEAFRVFVVPTEQTIIPPADCGSKVSSTWEARFLEFPPRVQITHRLVRDASSHPLPSLPIVSAICSARANNHIVWLCLPPFVFRVK